MKYCTKCGTALPDEVNFCSYCGTSQNPIAAPVEKPREENTAALTTLCILTIIGSVSGIFKGLFYESMSSFMHVFSEGPSYLLGYLSAVANVGTLAGAILMLSRKKTGYNIYAICQIACIALAILRTVQFTMPFDNDDTYMARHIDNSFSNFSLFLGVFFTVPSIVFLVLYTTLVKKQLR